MRFNSFQNEYSREVKGDWPVSNDVIHKEGGLGVVLAMTQESGREKESMREREKVEKGRAN